MTREIEHLGNLENQAKILGNSIAGYFTRIGLQFKLLPMHSLRRKLIPYICGLGANVGYERVERVFNTPRLKSQI